MKPSPSSSKSSDKSFDSNTTEIFLHHDIYYNELNLPSNHNIYISINLKIKNISERSKKRFFKRIATFYQPGTVNIGHSVSCIPCLLLPLLLQEHHPVHLFVLHDACDVWCYMFFILKNYFLISKNSQV